MRRFILLLFLGFLIQQSQAQKTNFSYLDVFNLQYVADPQISPNEDWVVYRRMGFDIMKDNSWGNLWMIKTDGSQHQKLSSREVSESSARWSPSGCLLYTSPSPRDQRGSRMPSSA